MAARELLPPGGQRCRLTMDSMGQLASFVTTDNVSMQFTYLGNSGLIESKEDNAGQTFVYEYDDYGRMTAVIQPTGERIVIASDHSAGLHSLSRCELVPLGNWLIDWQQLTCVQIFCCIRQTKCKNTIDKDQKATQTFKKWSTKEHLKTYKLSRCVSIFQEKRVMLVSQKIQNWVRLGTISSQSRLLSFYVQQQLYCCSAF